MSSEKPQLLTTPDEIMHFLKIRSITYPPDILPAANEALKWRVASDYRARRKIPEDVSNWAKSAYRHFEGKRLHICLNLR